MKVCVIGAGKVGATIAEALSEENHDIVVIDRKREILDDLSNCLDVLCVHGNAVNLATLREAGADQADILIAACSSDEINMLCCIFGK